MKKRTPQAQYLMESCALYLASLDAVAHVIQVTALFARESGRLAPAEQDADDQDQADD